MPVDNKTRAAFLQVIKKGLAYADSAPLKTLWDSWKPELPSPDLPGLKVWLEDLAHSLPLEVDAEGVELLFALGSRRQLDAYSRRLGFARLYSYSDWDSARKTALNTIIGKLAKVARDSEHSLSYTLPSYSLRLREYKAEYVIAPIRAESVVV